MNEDSSWKQGKRRNGLHFETLARYCVYTVAVDTCVYMWYTDILTQIPLKAYLKALEFTFGNDMEQLEEVERMQQERKKSQSQGVLLSCFWLGAAELCRNHVE